MLEIHSTTKEEKEGSAARPAVKESFLYAGLESYLQPTS